MLILDRANRLALCVTKICGADSYGLTKLIIRKSAALHRLQLVVGQCAERFLVEYQFFVALCFHLNSPACLFYSVRWDV